MTKRLRDYKRCKVCKELVADVENCLNCANRDPDVKMRRPSEGKRGSVTLDIQEGIFE